MVKKNKENLNNSNKSIYYDLKEFYDRNQGELYSYQDFEIAGIREFKVITNKMRPFQSHEKNRLSNELMRILSADINNEEKLLDLNGFITLNPIINYYENLIKHFKVSVGTNKEFLIKIRDLIRGILRNSGSSEEIKLGLILAPICGIEDIEDILNVFSIHNDYLFYVLKAYDIIGNCNDIIFEMAKKSQGYGKVFCLINLCPTTNEIKKWMIEDGSSNNVAVPELLSYSMLSLELLDYLENTEFDINRLEATAKSFSMLLSDYGLDEIKDVIKVCYRLVDIIDELNGGIYSLYAVISILYSIEATIIGDYKTKGESVPFKIDNEYKSIIEKCKKICKRDIWHEIISSEISNIEVESSVLISCAEKVKYKLRKVEFEMVLKRDYSNALMYKYAFSTGNKSIRKCAFDLGMKNLPMNQLLSGQDELKIENLPYENIAQICFFIIIKYSKYEDLQDEYKDINLKALKSPLIETRIQAATNLQQFKDEFDSLDEEFINDAINTEMVGSVRRALNALLIKENNKEKKYVEVNESMQIEGHVKDVFLFNMNIAGTAHVDMSEVYNKLLEDDMLYLKREPGNPYDSNAIQITTIEGYVLGYIPKANNYILKNLMDKGKYLYGHVKEISDDYNHINIDIYLSYKDVIEEITTTLSLLSGEREHYLQ